jgi:Transglutaminase-like enzymes, putative cysteine proteases
MIFRGNLVWMLSAQAICILPLLIKLPLWIWAVWFLALFWRIQIHLGRWKFPSTWTKFALGIGCASGIYLTFSGVRGVEPMVGFLVCSFILKIVEMRTKKDALIVLFIGFIAVAAQFLFAQDVVAGVYGIFSLFILLTAWQAAFYSRQISLRQYFRIGGVLVLQAIPFMIILFVVMPRLAPLWAVPVPQGKGKTGFSDTLELGDLGELVRSPEVAFRVTFAGAAPLPQQLYWRGLVLDDFDGRRWQTAAMLSRPIGEEVSNNLGDDEVLRYSVIMEPHHYRWLFTLDPVLAAKSAQLRLEYDERGLLSAKRPVVNKAEYSATSLKTAFPPIAPLGEWERRRLTRLPEGSNPRAAELAAQWRAENIAPKETIGRALEIFHGEFVYTMRPPRLETNSIDSFLFESKRGFCEHFSSAFVFLMRAAGLPARIVVGYQGGEYNQREGYFVVRQSHAHAWAEVWIDGAGWQMVDPTAAVAPSRIESGVENALAADERELVGSVRWSSSLMYSLYQQWDAIGYNWNRWVLNYDKDSQRNLFSDLLGDASPWRVGVAFASASIILFAVYAAMQVWRRQRPHLRAEDRLVQVVLRKLTRRGFVRRPEETLGQFAARVAVDEPALGHELNIIARLYSASVYAEDPAAEQRFRLAVQKLLKRFPARIAKS